MPLFKGAAGKAKPKKAIDYVTDPNKAVIISSLSLDDSYYISGNNNNGSRDYARQFKETCDMYSKGKGFNERKYYHFKLSPDRADNPTPQQSHELAERMAKELFSAHECVIATHNDTDTIHSHIIVNAVSFETGKKLHMNIGEYRKSKDLADTLGVEMGFTPLDWKTKTAEKLDRIFADEAITPDKKYMSHAEQQIVKRDKTDNASWKEALRQAIDEAKAHCISRTEFQQYLQDNFGVTMPRNTGKTVSFIHPAVGEKYAVRGNKLGSDYTAAIIDQALQKNYERSLIDARLFTTEEQHRAAKTTTTSPTGHTAPTTSTAPATPASNDPATGQERLSEVRGRKRSAPRSISDVSAELRSLDESVNRITKGISAANADGNNDMAEEPYDNEQFHEKAAGGSTGDDSSERPESSQLDREIQPKLPQPVRAAQPELPEPVVKTGEHERNVQPKPKRRAHSHGR